MSKSEAYSYSLHAAFTAYSITTLPFVPITNPSTGQTSWTNLPSLGNTLCSSSLSNNYPTYTNFAFSYGPWYLGYMSQVKVDFPNLTSSASDPMNNDFKLYTKVLDNSGAFNNSWVLAYEYTSSVATVYEPQLFVGGNPTLNISSF